MTNTGKIAGGKEVAQRMVNADQWLVETLKNAGKITHDEAVRAAGVYIKNRVVKRDVMAGRYEFKHGAFLDADVIRRAVTVAA